ncbi:hypothetical protein [Halomonas ventosae]|uniref:Uncharacterized protein n=1 Tax=Halomonas ventosae TaxID=229007 RepID=A0A2T0VS11_9GAMM|nr:hypothetical protein [Halomonas ventosae]PRY73210.1 hypothetical protein BCL64_102291 [Halomonas ventosae]
MTSNPLPSVARLSRLLFETDPMHTCCRENGCVDEYERIARDLAARLRAGEASEAALRRVLADGFSDELVDQVRLEPVIDELEALIA